MSEVGMLPAELMNLKVEKFKNLNFRTITNTYLNKKVLNQLVNKKLFPKVVYQSKEKDLGTGAYRDTEIFNGYAQWVAHLYKDVKNEENLYR